MNTPHTVLLLLVQGGRPAIISPAASRRHVWWVPYAAVDGVDENVTDMRVT